MSYVLKKHDHLAGNWKKYIKILEWSSMAVSELVECSKLGTSGFEQTVLGDESLRSRL